MNLRHSLSLCVAAALCLFAGNAGATNRGWEVVHFSTAAAYYTGNTCSIDRLKLDATPFGGDSFGIGLTCATWKATKPKIEVGQGTSLLSLGVVGKGHYYDCRYLDEDNAPVSYLEVECFGSFYPSNSLDDAAADKP